jgi:putative transposase
MKRSRLNVERVIGILREQEAGSATADVCRRHGISSATFYKWMAKFGGLEVSDARRLKALQEENVRLKPPAGRCDARQCHSERHGRKKMVTPDVKRAAVVHGCAVHGVSQRRACTALAVDRSTARYVTRRSDAAELRAAIRQVASERRWFGYRRIVVMLARRGITMNQKKLRRRYSEEKLQVRRRGGR